MSRIAILALALFALNGQAANVTATTGWLTKFDSNNISGDLTIDAGSNRKFLIQYIDHQNLTTETCSASITVTVGGVAPSETLQFLELITTSPDQLHCAFIWTEAAIGSMTGTTVSWSAISNNDISFLYGTIEDTDQDAIGSFPGVKDPGGGDLSVTTTSVSGDLITCGATHDLPDASYTSWDTLTEIGDSAIAGDNSRHAYAAGNGGDSPTAIVVDEPTNDDHSAACLVFADAATGAQFTSAPAKTGDTTSSITVGFTTDIDATVYGVACNKDSTPPTGEEIVAGECAPGNGVIDTCTAETTGSVADECVYDVVAPIRVVDIYHVACPEAGLCE